ncbi:hypothetical protein [Marinilactibacillus kalidii]|uniref:hypothetical protein n=1 Tax=Marinilactibacillus kalidii TaxID=2820274 RepID=UPI001ABE36A7|nr:hypothetical protein [Marinilactibacillus kalidii]
MKKSMFNTIEQESQQLEKKLRKMNIFVNHNYIRVEKGLRPFFHDPIGLGLFNDRFALSFYYLVFAKNQLVLLKSDVPTESMNQQVIRIDYTGIKGFELNKYFRNHYFKFMYEEKTYYFYISYENKKFFSLGETVYSTNYKILKEQNFMGLLK